MGAGPEEAGETLLSSESYCSCRRASLAARASPAVI